jgi:hypothetical protein
MEYRMFKDKVYLIDPMSPLSIKDFLALLKGGDLDEVVVVAKKLKLVTDSVSKKELTSNIIKILKSLGISEPIEMPLRKASSSSFGTGGNVGNQGGFGTGGNQGGFGTGGNGGNQGGNQGGFGTGGNGGNQGGNQGGFGTGEPEEEPETDGNGKNNGAGGFVSQPAPGVFNAKPNGGVGGGGFIVNPKPTQIGPAKNVNEFDSFNNSNSSNRNNISEKIQVLRNQGNKASKLLNQARVNVVGNQRSTNVVGNQRSTNVRSIVNSTLGTEA